MASEFGFQSCDVAMVKLRLRKVRDFDVVAQSLENEPSPVAQALTKSGLARGLAAAVEVNQIASKTGKAVKAHGRT